MRCKSIALFFLVLFAVGCTPKATNLVRYDSKISEEYPVTNKGTDVDNYYGKNISDPFRWLEDDKSPETIEWTKTQNTLTENYMSKIPFRNDIRNRLKEIWEIETFSSFIPASNGKFYYNKKSIESKQPVIYVTDNIYLDGEEFIDPSRLSKDGTTSVDKMNISPNGTLVAYQVQKAGSDWSTIRIMDSETQRILPDRIEWVKYSELAWVDEDGFYYSRYPEPEKGDFSLESNKYHSLYYHKIGDPQYKDELVYRNQEDPYRSVGVTVATGDRYLILSEYKNLNGNTLNFVDRKNGDLITTVVSNFDFTYSYIGNIGSKFYFYTNRNASNAKVIMIDAENPEIENWQTVIPEQEFPITEIKIGNDKIFVAYTQNAKSELVAYNMKGEILHKFRLPGLGTVAKLSGNSSSTDVFYEFKTYTEPPSVVWVDTETFESQIIRKSKINYDPELFETIQKWYTSKDGTKIPMFILKRKDVKLNGNNPALIYGYGGFGRSMQPKFVRSIIPFLEQGGIYVEPNIRGGREFGDAWHKQGMKKNKETVVDDFISAAEFLIKHKYTSSDLLAIEGRAAGGVIIGNLLSKRPDLFKVAIGGRGIYDLLRYQYFTIGWAWVDEFGSSEVLKEFKYLQYLSPLHNIKERDYPASFFLTADHDDRVVPGHTFKFVAELQDKQVGYNPVLLRVNKKTATGFTRPTYTIIEENTDRLSFLFFNMGLPYKKIEN